MGPEGRVSNCGSLVNALCVLFPCRVVILRKDNLTWCVQDALFLTRRLFPRVHLNLVVCLLRNCKKFVRGCARGFAVLQSLDLALCIAVPEGHGLGEVCQLVGPNEDASRKNRRRQKNSRRAEERKNSREGTCLAPSRGMREREHEQTRAEKR